MISPYICKSRSTCAAMSAVLCLLAMMASPCLGQSADAYAELNKLPFFLGREYFLLRSGRAQMIVQADRADLGPAFTFLLYDAQDARQSAHKDRAFNYTPGEGFAGSALQVRLGGFNFTALGHRTDTRWVMEEGIPAVEACWWAGGIRVRERLSALSAEGLFRRSIHLQGMHLVGDEQVTLRLGMPVGEYKSGDGFLLQGVQAFRSALVVQGQTPMRASEKDGLVEIGPITVVPKTDVAIETLLVVRIPAGDAQSLVVQVQSLRARAAHAELDLTRRQWGLASSISTRDAPVQELFDKVRYGLPGVIADDGTMNAGTFEYGSQWVRDTSNTALGALHAGHFELARAAAVRMLTRMIAAGGVTMIAGGFDEPDREQFDQMGELLHFLREYRDWTGDDALIREHRELLLSLIERPLQPQFRDDTGMVHNRREFWERTFEDAYELAYQTYVILGLREAVELAPSLQAEDRADRWRLEADRILQAALHHPTRSLVQDNHLIKRRNVDGTVADLLQNYQSDRPDVPAHTERHHRLLPDASQALPLALGVVDARSELARNTLDDLEGLWNTRWSDGGYDRYHTSSQLDQPGPWTFATCFILRAQHETGLFERSRRSLEWLNTVQGGRAGSWFEEIPSVHSLTAGCGLVHWTAGEIALFITHHYLGVGFQGGALVLHPALYPGSPPVSADLRFRRDRLKLQVPGSGKVMSALVNGEQMPIEANGSVRLPVAFSGGTIVLVTKPEDK